ncbi:MAG: hypothetical protein AAGJ69_01590 [Cyanobacteria bacterium J06559_1]
MASRASSTQKVNSQTAQSFNFGEIHAVQDRFQALIKQRLLSEYENNPPLFPWESEVGDYPAEVSNAVGAAISKPAALWGTHMSSLKVSGLLPTPLLNALFARCQSLVSEHIKEGIRLVRAVEASFPDQGELLEPIANMVLVPAYRSSDTSTQAALTQELTAVAGEYDTALPEQQIALSMLAAQEILGALTLSVSTDQPEASRQWLTSLGTLGLSVRYTPEQLTLEVSLPDGGQVRLWDGDLEKRALRSQPGPLDLVLVHPGFDKTYLLQVSLQAEEKPLNFAIHLGDA